MLTFFILGLDTYLQVCQVVYHNKSYSSFATFVNKKVSMSMKKSRFLASD